PERRVLRRRGDRVAQAALAEGLLEEGEEVEARLTSADRRPLRDLLEGYDVGLRRRDLVRDLLHARGRVARLDRGPDGVGRGEELCEIRCLDGGCEVGAQVQVLRLDGEGRDRRVGGRRERARRYRGDRDEDTQPCVPRPG